MKLKMYESDITKFVRDMLKQNPQLQQKRETARLMWWDKPADFEERRRNKESKIPQQGYYYQTKV